MKKLFGIVTAVILLLGLLSAPVRSAGPEAIQDSIEDGVEWLVNMQNEDGSWGMSEMVASTSFVLIKLEERAFELGYDSPFDEEYPFRENVEKGLDFLFSQAVAFEADEIIYSPSIHTSYNTGIAIMAVAGSGTPDRTVTISGEDWTYREVVQGSVNFFARTQREDGGWRYYADDRPSDNSNTGFVVLGLRYAEDFGCTIPAGLKTNLSSFIDLIQDDVDGDTYDGCSWYIPIGDEGWRWANTLRAGNLLFEAAFVGDTVSSQRVQDALDYIGRHWNDDFDEYGYPEWGNPDYPNALSMYCLMKGFVSLGIETINVDGSEVDWFDEFTDIIVATQDETGYWSGDWWLDEFQQTAINLLTLEKIAPSAPVVVEVPFDIKPMSWPNPLNEKDHGVLPAAVLGTDEFDVSQIDPDSVLLEGVAPLRWNVEDAGKPGDPLAGPDGFADLVLKFDAGEVAAALGTVTGGDELTLQLTGSLFPEYGGQSIAGEDVVVIIDK